MGRVDELDADVMGEGGDGGICRGRIGMNEFVRLFVVCGIEVVDDDDDGGGGFDSDGVNNVTYLVRSLKNMKIISRKLC